MLIPPQAKKKVAEKGWKNVEVVEGDACQFAPPEGAATLVTFSYSLTSERGMSEAVVVVGVPLVAATAVQGAFIFT